MCQAELKVLRRKEKERRRAHREHLLAVIKQAQEAGFASVENQYQAELDELDREDEDGQNSE